MTNFFSLMRKSITGLGRYPSALLIGWLVISLALPALQFHASEKTFLQALSLVVLLQVAFVLNALYRVWGWWGMLRAVVGVVLLSWIILAIVVRSGLPYGNLTYTAVLQPQVLDVPLLIPLAWMMMLPPAWAVARLITRKLTGCVMHLSFISLSAVAFTAWGLYFEPLMVNLGFEQWNPAGEFFGVPWLHFLGWLVVSGVITFGLSPKRIPGGVLVLVYGLTWLVDFITLFVFWNLPGPAFAGLGMMGLMLVGAAIVNR
jgi:uncharacterized membrane protein